MRTLRGVDRWSIWIVPRSPSICEGSRSFVIFGVRELDGDTATAVAGEDGTAAVDGAVRELSRGGVEQVAMLVRPEGMPKISTMGSTGVDANVHEEPDAILQSKILVARPARESRCSAGIFAKAQ